MDSSLWDNVGKTKNVDALSLNSRAWRAFTDILCSADHQTIHSFRRNTFIVLIASNYAELAPCFKLIQLESFFPSNLYQVKIANSNNWIDYFEMNFHFLPYRFVNRWLIVIIPKKCRKGIFFIKNLLVKHNVKASQMYARHIYIF